MILDEQWHCNLSSRSKNSDATGEVARRLNPRKEKIFLDELWRDNLVLTVKNLKKLVENNKNT